MKKEIWKRMLCVATATVVCLTSIPGTVFADETGCKEAKDGKHVPNEAKKELVKMATCTEDGEWADLTVYTVIHSIQQKSFRRQGMSGAIRNRSGKQDV